MSRYVCSRNLHGFLVILRYLTKAFQEVAVECALSPPSLALNLGRQLNTKVINIFSFPDIEHKRLRGPVFFFDIRSNIDGSDIFL